MRRIWDIPGGVHPPENKQQSMQQPLGNVPLPQELVFPLNQHIGQPATPIIEVGDTVLAGQKIAEAVGVFSAPVHASTSGTITAIEDRPLPHASGLWGKCIVLNSDGQHQAIAYDACEDYTQLSHRELIDKIREAGIAGLGGAGFPTAVKLNPSDSHTIDTLILNGTECEPYITADDTLMQTRADEIIQGALLLSFILRQPSTLIIGIEDNKPDAIKAMQAAAKGTHIEIATFPTKYPSGGEKQLVQILTGQEVPAKDIPASLGIVVQNIGTAVAAYRAVRFGEPLTSRITTVVGQSLQTQRNIEVLLGTPISHILHAHGFNRAKAAKLIMGGPMMGFALQSDEAPVVKTTNCILAPSHDELPAQPPAQACIRCGMCAEACPASLLPQQLYWYAQAEDYERAQNYHLMDCIECGACSYVCPSNIPLVQHYRAAKGIIRQQAEEKLKSDHARQRFEFRQRRMEKAEAEKEAKRLARKKAAEAAKAKAANKPATTPDTPSSQPTDDPVAAAMARLQEKKNDPQAQQAKLERTLSSTRERLAKLQQKLDQAEGDQREKISAQIKQAQVRLQDAEKNLTEHNNSPTQAAPTDPVAAAIAKAQAKVSMSADEKLKDTIASLDKRIARAQTKLSSAPAEQQAILQASIETLNAKRQDAQTELKAILQQAPDPATTEQNTTQDAANAAITKAKEKAAAMATMTPAEKQLEQIASLEKRLKKAKARFEKAQSDGDDNIDAFRSGVEKLSEKLAQAKDAAPKDTPE